MKLFCLVKTITCASIFSDPSKLDGEAVVNSDLNVLTPECAGRPDIEFAENVDCKTGMIFGQKCTHMCGDVVIESQCLEKTIESKGVTLVTGDTIWKHSGTCAKLTKETAVEFKGLKATSPSVDVCESNMAKLGQKLVDKIQDTCDTCTAEVTKNECKEQGKRRKRRNGGTTFDVELEINVKEEKTVAEEKPVQTDSSTGETKEVVEEEETKEETKDQTTDNQTEKPEEETKKEETDQSNSSTDDSNDTKTDQTSDNSDKTSESGSDSKETDNSSNGQDTTDNTDKKEETKTDSQDTSSPDLTDLMSSFTDTITTEDLTDLFQEVAEVQENNDFDFGKTIETIEIEETESEVKVTEASTEIVEYVPPGKTETTKTETNNGATSEEVEELRSQISELEDNNEDLQDQVKLLEDEVADLEIEQADMAKKLKKNKMMSLIQNAQSNQHFMNLQKGMEAAKKQMKDEMYQIIAQIMG